MRVVIRGKDYRHADQHVRRSLARRALRAGRCAQKQILRSRHRSTPQRECLRAARPPGDIFANDRDRGATVKTATTN